MVYQVQQLLEGKGSPLTIKKEDSVSRALSLMIEHDYSQLPVIENPRNADNINLAIGMVTYESILRGLLNFDANIEELKVRDVTVSAPVFTEEDDLFDILDRLKETNAVLINFGFNGHLIGIITSYDTSEYFRNRTEDMMRVEDIELTIKEFIKAAYTNKDDVLDKAALNTAIQRVSAYRNKDNADVEIRNFDDLTLGEYISLLLLNDTWHFFEPIFGVSKANLRKLMHGIREIRNALAHFRGDISSDQRDKLKFGVTWLSGRQEEFEKQKEQELFDYAVSQLKEVEKTGTITEPFLEIAEERGPKDSRYTPLIDWLQSQPGNIEQIPISFQEIEEIIDGKLPKSAYSHRAWWANDTQGHTHSQLWLEAGWRSAYINMTNQHVTFTRIREREKAYIDFYSKLLLDLRENAQFTIRDFSPGGKNWMVCYAISESDTTIANYGFSFARGQRFRVELYIDTGDRGTNKRIFDLVHAEKEKLEIKFPSLTWERISDKRASRIAIYHPGSITDVQEKLDTLKDWAVDKMIAFYNAIEPIASRAAKEALNT